MCQDMSPACISVLPLLAPELRASPPTVRAVRCGGCCLSALKTQKSKPSAIHPAKSHFVWPQPLLVSARRGMFKPPWGGGALQSLCSITWQGSIAKRRGESGRAGGALMPVPQCRAAAHAAPPDLQHQHPLAVCVHFVFPAAHPPALPGSPLSGAEAADMSQGKRHTGYTMGFRTKPEQQRDINICSFPS